METIRTLIVDDEELARRRLRRMLAAFADVEVIGEAANGAEAVARIEADRPGLVLLDVQMPDLSGFEALAAVASAPLPAVIFVTAYDQYAVRAFEVSAVDYLLKPVSQPRLAQALDRLRERRAARDSSADQLRQLLAQFRPGATPYLQRLPVRAQNRILILPLDQITSLQVDRGLVCATTADGLFWTKHEALTDIEAQLDPAHFRRIHRQAIVNLNHILEINALDNNTARLTLTGGRQLNVSRAHLRELRQLLNW